MNFLEELGIMGTEFWRNCCSAAIQELPEYDSQKKKKKTTEPHTGCCGVTLSVLESKLSTAKAGCGTFRDHWGLLISSHCHHECKTAPSLSEPVRPAWGLMFCPFKLSQILGTAYSLSKSMDQAPTPQIFSHSLSIRFSLMCSQLLFHP